MFIKDRQKKEHAVRVFQNGKSYTVYINGNPAVSQAVNRDFKEMPIINQWAKNTSPGYKRIRINKKGEAYAPQFLVDFARLSDNVTFGDGIKKGLVSFNPDEVQHITEGYFGGLYTTISQTVDMIYIISMKRNLTGWAQKNIMN
jgi:hypothetical protein